MDIEGKKTPALPVRPWTRRALLRGIGLTSLAAWSAGRGLLAQTAPTAPTEAEPPPPPPGPPTLAGPQAGYYRLKIGDLDALVLQDGGLTPPANQTPFAIDEPNGSVEKALEEAGLPTARVPIPFNVLLVRLGPELLLIDSGAGSAFGESAGHLPRSLKAAGVREEQVTAILLTHAHRDHFGGLVDPETKAPRFPNARVFIGRKEHDFWMGGTPELSGMAVPAEASRSLVESARSTLGALAGKLELVAGGDHPLEGIELLDTPGHTPGHLSALVGSGADRLLHMGDVATHHAISFRHPEWRFAYDADPALAVETRRKLLDRAATERLRLFGAHLPFPALGWARKAREAAAYEFVPEPFALA